ncbi:hypothetical protein Tsubulata_049865 [Turnera subulata]|uniref:Endonuclease/exonuclease/phosphatase domain-containing protein n=1 Tax=Turnera subulata TaxID=218843 RepID=A0A9Q0G581_9ROSI|nr:hypothetical protein Tsubulata_049865 [Turnera subulata]
MKHNTGVQPLPGHSRAAAKPRRAQQLDDKNEEHHHHHRMQRKFVSQTKVQTLTLKANISRHNFSSSSSNYKAIQKKKKHSYRRRDIGYPLESNRKWTFSSRDTSNYKDKIVFVSYNILGVENAAKHPDLYTRVPPECLDWDRRKQLICEEVNRYNAGILCFQEVDRFKDLDGILKKDGFRGVYKVCC